MKRTLTRTKAGTMAFAFMLLLVSGCSKKHVPVPIETVEVERFIDPDDSEREHLLAKPATLRKDREGNIMVLDKDNHRIVKYAKDGQYRGSIGSVGQGPGELLDPVDFDVDHNGKIYVLENGNQRVSVFSAKGRFLSSFRTAKVSTLTGLCVKDSLAIYVNQPSLHGPLFFKYDWNGKLLGEIGKTDPFENRPIKGISPLATRFYNEVISRVAADGDIVVFYRTRPLYRRYNDNGNMISEKEITGSEIDSTWAYLNKRLSVEKPEPNVVKGATFVYDFDFLNTGEIMLLVAGIYGGYEHIYRINASGNVIGKIRYLSNKSAVVGATNLLTKSSDSFYLSSYFTASLFKTTTL